MRYKLFPFVDFITIFVVDQIWWDLLKSSLNGVVEEVTVLVISTGGVGGVRVHEYDKRFVSYLLLSRLYPGARVVW